MKGSSHFLPLFKTRFLLILLLVAVVSLVGVVFLNRQASHQQVLRNKASWQSNVIASIDTMKESRDTENHPLTRTQIANDVNLSASLNTNYVTVDTHWEYDTYMKQWIDAVRATGHHVWFRIQPSQWEDSNGTTGIMTPTQYEDAEKNFILTHSSYFQPGDILDPCPEAENGLYWDATYGRDWISGAPNAATAKFNAFLRDSTDEADLALHKQGIYGVITTIRSTNTFFPLHPKVLEATTVQKFGIITIDSYPENYTLDPITATNARIHELNAIENIWHKPIILGEMGYSIKVRVDDATQEVVLRAEFNALSDLPYLAGVNYWVGAEKDTPTRTSPHIFSSTTGAWMPRPAAYDLSNFYKVERARTVVVASDGTGDFTSIDAAVMALGNAGGKIILEEGLYTPAILAPNIWLLGSGDKSIIRIPNGSQANAILATRVNNVLISNLRIDGNRAKTDNSGPTYTSVNGIRVDNSRGVSIDSVSVTNTYYGGITIDSSNNISITNNRISGTRDNGIFLRPGNNDIIIRGNTVSAASYSGIQCLRSDKVSISNNVTYNNGPTQAEGDGIGSEGCRYTSIFHNTIYSNGAQGVKVDYTMEGSTTPQRSFHVSVISNSIYNQQGQDLAAILVTRSDFTQVSGNYIYNNYHGVNIGEVGETIISGNFVARSFVAIRAYDTQAAGPITISNNNVQESNHNQIELSSGNTKIIGNKIQYGTAGSIRINAGSNYVIANNTIFGNADNNIQIASGVAGVRF